MNHACYPVQMNCAFGPHIRVLCGGCPPAWSSCTSCPPMMGVQAHICRHRVPIPCHTGAHYFIYCPICEPGPGPSGCNICPPSYNHPSHSLMSVNQETYHNHWAPSESCEPAPEPTHSPPTQMPAAITNEVRSRPVFVTERPITGSILQSMANKLMRGKGLHATHWAVVVRPIHAKAHLALLPADSVRTGR